MGKARGRKTVTVTARLTERQFNKLELIRTERDLTMSELLRDIVGRIGDDVAMSYQQNSNAGSLVLADPAGIAR